MGSVAFWTPMNPSAAWYDEAEPFACTSPKLPDLECALASLEPDADSPGPPMISGGGARAFRPSCGPLLVPMGVTRLSCGVWRGWGAFRVGIPLPAPLVTGRAFGDGGMDRPSWGGPLLPGRAPGMGGRSRGAGDDMLGCG